MPAPAMSVYKTGTRPTLQI